MEKWKTVDRNGKLSDGKRNTNNCWKRGEWEMEK